KTMPARFSEGLSFTDGRAELPGVIQTLRRQEKADLVLLDSHLGFPQDMQLLQEISGVDVDLSAHTHHRLERPARQGRTLVIQSGSHASFITRLNLTLENRKVTDFSHRLIEISQAVEPDPEVQAMVDEALKPFKAELDELVGETRTALDRGINLESTMDNLLLSALLAHTGAEMAFSNGWRYGAPIPKGPIRLNHLYNMAPMNPPISTAEISGTELLTMLEENLEHTFSRDPTKQMGGYVKRALGIKVFFKIENPPYQRIQKLFINNEELQPDRQYRTAFITEQGIPARFGQNRQQHPDRIVDVMRIYLKQTGPIEMPLFGTYTPI
ncbi:MAG: 5'-nucleotidase C-terminal domain-containing protein, partial [Anaerolineaceae bacterium]